MTESALHRLAERAGLLVHWHDYRGRLMEVPASVLQRTLATLELPAGSPAQINASLLRLEQEAREQLPSLAVLQAGEPWRLPPALANVKRLELQLEDGSRRSLQVQDGADGAQLPAIAEVGYHQLEADGRLLKVAVAPRSGYGVADAAPGRRIWGLAAQAYSLRRAGDGGIGDFGALADAARAAAAQGADLLTVSPLHALFPGDPDRYGPYAPSSRLFVNAMHVDPGAVLGTAALRVALAKTGLAERWQQLETLPLIDWPAAQRCRLAVLRQLWTQFSRRPRRDALTTAYARFVAQGGGTLAAHARFDALHTQRFAADATQWNWRNWPEALRDPHGAAVATFAAEQAGEVGFHLFLQWLADEGCAAAQAAAKAAGMAVGLVSDLAVGADSGGSQTWAHQQDMLVGLSIGAPPDLLNTLGQNWGLTTFSPRALQQHAYAPFLDLLRAALRHAGGVRIDHVLGLGRLWLTPDGETDGCYLRYPLTELFRLIALESQRHRALVIGEDLGTVPDGFREPLGNAGILGMRVLWFERDHGLFVEPPRWSTQALAMTTTHDLPTVAGWWRGNDIRWRSQLGLRSPELTEEAELAERTQDREKLWNAFLHTGAATLAQPAPDDPQPAVDAAIAQVAATACPLAIVPLEDIAGLEQQPNIPGTLDGHPNWRRRLPLATDALLAEPRAAARLAALRSARP